MLWPPAVVVLSCVAVFVVGALLSASEDALDGNFEEGGPIDILSAVFLTTAGIFAAACFRLRDRGAGADRFFWLLLAAGFFFVALDEMLQFHETVDEWLRDTWVGWPPYFRNWNDVIVISYGVVGLAALARFRSEVRRLPRVVCLLGLGIAFYTLHTGIDALVSGSVLKNLVEESAKLTATAFFALAMAAACSAMASSGLDLRTARPRLS